MYESAHFCIPVKETNPSISPGQVRFEISYTAATAAEAVSKSASVHGSAESPTLTAGIVSGKEGRKCHLGGGRKLFRL